MLDIVLSTYKKNRITILRAYPWSFVIGRLTGGISAVVFPFLVYTYFFNGVVSDTFQTFANSSDYITYVVIGAAVHTLGVATLMNVGRALITEFREGTIEPILISPASRLGYFVGCLSEQLGRSFLEFGVVLILGAILGANLLEIISISSLIVITLTLFSFFSMAILLSSVMLYTRDTYLTQNTLFNLMILLTGVSFPIEYLPNSLQMISKIIPMTYAIKLFRGIVLNGEDIVNHSNLVFALLGLSFIYFVVGFIWHRFIEKKMIEEIFG